MQKQDDNQQIFGENTKPEIEECNNFMKDINWTTFWWELFGVALFAYGICACNGNDFFVTFVFFGVIIFTAPFSGGHVNPAVSFAFWVTGDIKFFEWIYRAIAQVIGSFVGGLFAHIILAQAQGPAVPLEDSKWSLRDIFGEVFGTFVFITIIMIAVKSETTYNTNKIIQLLMIALALHISRVFTSKSGGALNPALAFGLEFWLSIKQKDFTLMSNYYIYLIGPILGGALAGLYFKSIHLDALKNDPEKKKVMNNQQYEKI